MGLNFGTLIQAALGGSAAYSSGKRTGRIEKEEREARRIAAEEAADYRRSMIRENEEQTAAAKHKRENPEMYRNPRSIPAHEARTSWIDEQMAAGVFKTGAEAADAADDRFGRNGAADRGPVRGSPEYYGMIEKESDIRNQASARHRRPLQGRGGRDTGEAGSAKDAVDRREFFQKWVPHYINEKGMSGAAAQAAAERLYRGAEYSANSVSRSASPTAQALARSVPGAPKKVTAAPPGWFEDPKKPGIFYPKANGSGGPANAGARGVKPTETSSTQRANPSDPNSPRAGAVRPVTAADMEAAIAAVGEDPDKIDKWLSKNRIGR